MLHRLYHRILGLSARPSAPLWLALIAFAEASFFPVPPDVLLIPMVIARPARAWRLAAICTAASVAGGALGYLIGWQFFDQIVQPVLRFYGYGAAMASFESYVQRYGLWWILIKGLTPIPYKIVTIGCGAGHFPYWKFMGASLITRGARFFLVAGLLRVYGEPIRDFIERRLGLVTLAFAVALVGGFLAMRYL